MKKISVLLTVLTAALNLAGCTKMQSVQGSYATPSKRVEGTALGFATAAILAPGSVTTASGGVIGNAIGNMTARHRLMNTIAEHGVQVISQGDMVRIILPTDRFFLHGEPTLDPENYPTLDFIAALLKEYGRARILIAGFTDDVANAKQNLILSQQQAESVLGYLWVHGVDYQHLKAKGYGNTLPIANEETVAGKAMNRRVVITLRDGCY